MCRAGRSRIGASVTILECAPFEYRGGNSRHTRNMRCMHERPTDVLTDTYAEDEYFADLMRVTGGNTTEELARLVIHESPQCERMDEEATVSAFNRRSAERCIWAVRTPSF